MSQSDKAFLITVNTELDAVIVQDILKQNSIPSLKRHKGMGEYLTIVTGMSSLGIDIFVPASLLESAKEIVEAIPL